MIQNYNPKFSILIPAFKSRYFRECLESIISQTYSNFEIIVVNDASPENIQGIINELSDFRIKYYENKINCGAYRVVDNWNKCLSYSSGDYILCMGDDDKLKPNCLDEYVRLINKYPDVKVFHALTEIIDEDGFITDIQESRPECETVYSMLYGRWRHRRIQFIGDWLFESNSLKQMNGFYFLPNAWGSDDMTATILSYEKGIVNSQIPLFQYRINRLTISKRGNDIEKIKAIKTSGEIYSDLLKTKNQNLSSNEAIYHDLCKRYLDTYINKRIEGQLYYYFKNRGHFLSLYLLLREKKNLGITFKIIVKSWIKSLSI